MAHNNDLVRNKLIEITDKGLMLKAIALNVGIDVNDLSRFKGGMNCLKQADIKRLSEYLEVVIIPQWNTVTKRLQRSLKRKRVIETYYFCNSRW